MEGPDDSTIIYGYLPIEVWLLIAKAWTDPRDLTSLSAASQVFRNLLSPRRVEFLFSEVWRVLGMKLEIRKGESLPEDEVSSNESDSDSDDIDYLYREKKSKCVMDILTLRLVCKSWCEGVDLFYENPPGPGHYAMEWEGKVPWDERNQERIDYFSSGKQVGSWIPNEFAIYDNDMEWWMEHFQESHIDVGNSRNPTIGRFLSITHRARDRETDDVITDFLELINPHIRFSQMKFYDDHSSRVLLYRQMYTVLPLLSNLKTIKLEYKPGLLATERSIRREYGSIEDEIAIFPMPTLPHLEFMSIIDFPNCVSNALIAANNHIAGLEIKQNDRWVVIEPVFNVYTVSLPNLKQLSIRCSNNGGYFENLNKPEVNWPLEKVYLDFGPPIYTPWSSVFSLLETKWASTLTSLAVYLPRAREWEQAVEVFEESLSLRLNLPKVQRLQITARNIWSLDFILPMRKTLEVLEVTVITNSMFHYERCNRNKQLQLLAKRQIIQFGGYFCQFQESNIWKLFRRLRKICFVERKEQEHKEGTIYTRQQWRERDKSEGNEIQPCCSFNK